MEKKPRTYIRGIYFRERKTSTGKTLFNQYITPKFLEFMNEHKDEKGGISIDIWPLDVPDKFSNTHSLVLNEYVSNKNGEAQAQKASYQANKQVELPNDFGGDDDLPF